MTVKRFMVVKENGNIIFTKVTTENGENEITEVREYTKKTQTELDFAQEVLKRFENEFPEWADVLEWVMIAEDDLQDWLKDSSVII